MIYNALISSYFNYGILVWGYHCNRLSKLQKMSIRHLTKSKYNAHTYPLFKRMNILTISDLFYLSQLKFFINLLKTMFLNILNIPFLSQKKLFMADILETEAVFQFLGCATLLQKILFDTASLML